MFVSERLKAGLSLVKSAQAMAEFSLHFEFGSARGVPVAAAAADEEFSAVRR